MKKEIRVKGKAVERQMKGKGRKSIEGSGNRDKLRGRRKMGLDGR